MNKKKLEIIQYMLKAQNHGLLIIVKFQGNCNLFHSLPILKCNTREIFSLLETESRITKYIYIYLICSFILCPNNKYRMQNTILRYINGLKVTGSFDNFMT